MTVKSRVEFTSRSVISRNWALLFCLASFCAGMVFTNRMWTVPEAKVDGKSSSINIQQINSKPESCNQKHVVQRKLNESLGEEAHTQQNIDALESKISSLEMKLAAVRTEHELKSNASPAEENSKRKYLMVVGINTAFSSRKRRDSVRATWMPQGEKLKQLEKEKGIIIRFVIGHSSTSGGILDKAVEAEEQVHGDFLRLDHVEGYLELSAKTKIYFATAVKLWDAEYYIKVDDDVHVNIATLGRTLAEHRNKPRVYIGCMKSGPVLARTGVKYHEPEYWKFGEVGNKYFRHATGQLYAISKDLATYISINQNLLHKYANEDVSLGSWFIGLDVEHVDDRSFCCSTRGECEWRAQAGNYCVASFDWKCSGICRSVERIMDVHENCGENKNALWHTSF
ncbi:putative beta-1 3-galactosyltransferase 2 -like protein [Tripterygium wilfordii]|uniref:Hexosyltransferase n=1 Tax=Tripterygium wilfordii TaxID=458696 RepID=A0A7J7C4I7_TRIWF|nr:probable beta-1,3-galactosyltransferase 2 [Tripterygium wilfordii]KAF5729060.1 putative beta-1 3-galactosyltransferase 2 -like protein [Tripterygium wilfordii]